MGKLRHILQFDLVRQTILENLVLFFFIFRSFLLTASKPAQDGFAHKTFISIKAHVTELKFSTQMPNISFSI